MGHLEILRTSTLNLKSNTKEIFHFNDQDIKIFPVINTTK